MDWGGLGGGSGLAARQLKSHFAKRLLTVCRLNPLRNFSSHVRIDTT